MQTETHGGAGNADDRRLVTELIERWAEAVHTGDLDTVLADHADDIVMFDVPPPHDGVRGLAAYRETWPPFFRWQAQGAAFEIISLEVTAGDDVAFAHALLRCGTPQDLARDPGHHLRLTIGLRKTHGRWMVTHEHHSFADTSGDQDTPGEQDAAGRQGTAGAEEEVRAIHRHWFDRTAAGDLDGLMAHIDDDVVSYEHDGPLRHLGIDAVREVCRRGLDASSGPVSWEVPDLTVIARDDLAVAWGLNRIRAEQSPGRTEESWSRGTRVFRRTGGSWQMIHQHLSVPYDPGTGEARADLRP
ncbi:SgcJ/EcaC family oxidoreductase [Micromonospora sp. NPDC048909]|uniref:YybH family protein n=1 Tax=Micromonospora sp. NPDC048909 TaxID=3155643 RepID=UPI0034059BF9